MKRGSMQATELKKNESTIKIISKLAALENPRCSVVNYGTVGCTKDLTGKGKRLIIVD